MIDPPPDDPIVADDAIIGRAFRWSLAVIALIATVVALVFVLRPKPAPEPDPIERGPIQPAARLDQTTQDRAAVRFTDVTRAAGIDFTHVSGATGEKLLPETMGSGCAFLDYDDDGDQDLLLVNANAWPHDTDAAPGHAALYRNDGSGRFDDVTTDAGLDVTLYGMGVACGDVDGDGDVDVYVTAVGANRLFRNDAGRFVDTTDAAGVAGDPSDWGASAGFFDYDADGDLDLFVCNYVRWSRDVDLELNFTLNGTDRAYGPPKLYAGAQCDLYRNEGDGTFTDVSEEAHVHVTNDATGVAVGKALAVTFVDVDGDDWLDVLVANDTVRNFLFRNLGNGTFAEVGVASGLAFDQSGAATGAMGIDAVPFLDDGRIGVAIGNFANESSSFYVQQSERTWVFADMAAAEGIGSPSRLKLSFGVFFFDYDLDGRLDLLQVNGHLEDEINQIQPSQHYRQPAQLFWNCGADARSCFAAVPDGELGDLVRPVVGRGSAYADIDGDGDLDVVLTQTGGAPMLLRNDQDLDRHWLRVRLEGTDGNRDAIGAWVELETPVGTQRRQVMPTRSYLSQVELPVTFGLGAATEVTRLRVFWPAGPGSAGAVQEVDVDGVDRVVEIRQSVSSAGAVRTR